MDHFPEFHAKHGPAEACRSAPDATLRGYRGRLPDALLAWWHEVGWCAYSNGLIWTVNPDEFTKPLAEWLGPDDSALTIARTAFGDLIVWDETGSRYVDVIHDKVFPLIDDIEILFEVVLCRDEYLDKVLDRKLFRKAVAKFGPLAHDECFAFEPAIALGGAGTLSTIKKRKQREYLGLLAQLRDSE